jgi:hypothetical protein
VAHVLVAALASQVVEREVVVVADLDSYPVALSGEGVVGCGAVVADG